MKTICKLENLPYPHIITESGRALTAHYSVLVTNAIDQEKPVSTVDNLNKNSDDPLFQELWSIHNDLNEKNCREFYHDALYARRKALNQYKSGQLSLVNYSQFEELFWCILHNINAIRKEHRISHHELAQLDKLLASTCLFNFSIFQSLPDCWAIHQVFPVMPLQKLDQEPDVPSIIADLTCDSDGCISNYVSKDGIGNLLQLHKIEKGDDYYLGFFLVGAYQEILGDLHNLFGDTNAVHVVINGNDQYKIEHHAKGDRVRTVLEYLDYQSNELTELLRSKLEIEVASGRITVEDVTKLMSFFEQGMSDYTYLT